MKTKIVSKELENKISLGRLRVLRQRLRLLGKLIKALHNNSLENYQDFGAENSGKNVNVVQLRKAKVSGKIPLNVKKDRDILAVLFTETLSEIQDISLGRSDK